MTTHSVTRPWVPRVVLCAAVLAFLAVMTNLVDFEPVSATQPPPPTYYTLTINKSGGGDCTQFKIESPVVTDWSTTTIQQSFQTGTEIVLDRQTLCPCGFMFDHWESNDSELDGSSSTRLADFTINMNTTATAVFEPRTGTLVVYVDDPTPNSPLPHLHDPLSMDPGHAFWELRGSCAPPELACGLATWGFYPPGELNEDDGHGYTDRRSYVISQDQLISALYMTCFFIDNPPTYNGLTYNCTDALIDVAGAAGVTLWAQGSCEHFVGNCPGALGETLNLY